MNEKTLRAFPHLPKHKDGFPKAELRKLLGFEPRTILEIGCNDGRDTAEFAQEYPQAQIYCFEPDPRPIAQFKDSPIYLNPNVHLYEVAISDVSGETDFHMSGGTTRGAHKQDWDLSGSINRPTGHLTLSPWCKFDRVCRVTTIPLDHWAELSLSPETVVDFIWCDVQGAEHQLIAGGKRTLGERTRYIYTEFYEQEMYAGAPNLFQILERLPMFQPVAFFEGYNVLLRREPAFS